MDVEVNWPEVFDRYRVQYLFLDKEGDRELLRQFRTEPQWLVELENRESVLLARKETRQETAHTA
jgi:hypothetical protein